MGWGDEIMLTGIARRLQEKDPAPVRVHDKRGRARWSEIWNGNPRLARPDFEGRVQVVVNGPGRRPYIARETAARWFWRDWICPVGEIHLDEKERAFAARHAGKVIVEPELKSEASRNKDWGRERWVALARALSQKGHAVAQFATPGSAPLPGVETIRTATFRHACAVLARARLAVLPEGGLHHAAAALGTPTVVLFGGYISPRQTGYAHQLNLFTGGTPCGMRARCPHCRDAMRRIGIDEVVAKSLMLIAASAPAPD
jgi:hypothetical protein